ncbi:MAG: alpha-glucan family phosphorylase [Dehalococcoidia bacterium]|nr:alpha-glucan family phosphorylase [Dehalococcoidia bacterium]
MDSVVKDKIPERIEGLGELAHNLWWSWHPIARRVFKHLDRSLWKSTQHNPVALLNEIPYHQLVACAEDARYLNDYDACLNAYREGISPINSWFERNHHEYQDRLIAYFSLEFALHNSLPLYAGGLGVLAGDYCKEISDLGIPLVGVGFMYPQGYFHQAISQDGWQNEIYDQLNFKDVAVSRVKTADGKLLTVPVPLDSMSIYVSAWKVELGRVTLYLLDTNLEENPQAYRGLSARLYGGDREVRLLQELVIGLGGVRILRALGISPSIWHANEGHTAFMMVERIREMVREGKSLDDAVETVRSATVFTTHTPVPAGNDAFSIDLVDKYFHNYWDQLGLDCDGFMKFGTLESEKASYNMSVLGLKLAGFSNGVSKLHGQVCRKMWQPLWPDLQEEDVPICSITNGVHVPTWIAPQFNLLFSEYLAEDWIDRQDDLSMWDNIHKIPDELIWNTHKWLKLKLIGAILERARRRWAQSSVAPVQPLAMGALLDTEALTIGFCRRFTAYKRPTLIFRNLERLKKIMSRDLQPVQFIFAGKAHPNDENGKKLIQEVYHLAKDPQFGGRIAFVEDYDMHLARDLVRGVDVWLNNPRFLMEASGTSGQKASLNGVLNLSVLDGWWFEAFNGNNGWGIREKENADLSQLDDCTASAIYDLLENKVIPLYYEVDSSGMPVGWVKMMKECIRSNTPFFNTSRMAKEYTERFYLKVLAPAGNQ